MNAKEMQALIADQQREIKVLKVLLDKLAGIEEKKLEPKFPTFSSIPAGTVFRFESSISSARLLKIQPVDKFFNSHMISDILNRGDGFFVNLRTGVFSSGSGDLPVIILNEKEGN